VSQSGEGRIVQLSVSAGGVPKLAIPATRVSSLGLQGDAHRYEHHGGLERAVCLFSLEAIDALAAEGHTIGPGTIGENVTVEGIDWNRVTPGVRLRLGERVVLEVTRYTSPCYKIAPVFLGGEYSRVSQKRNPGWSRVYTRVLVEGSLRAGDPIRVLAERAAAEVGAAQS
jgi:MOSC domain-containing protein YiiM